jgi:hypothetical protein
VWLRAAAKTRPGRGQHGSPWPSTRSTRIDNQVRAKVHLQRGQRLPGTSAG